MLEEKKQEKTLKLIDAKFAIEYLSIGRSTFYEQIKKGLIPKPFNMFGNTKRWAYYEIEQIAIAYIKEIGEEKQKELVKDIENRRRTINL